jgi:hypothetical protein
MTFETDSKMVADLKISAGRIPKSPFENVYW